MTLLLHFDSSKVSFDSVADLVPAGIRFPNTEAGIVVEDDPAASGGGDGDATTDKFIQVVWGTLDSSFPAGINDAANVVLYTAQFTANSDFSGSANFNFSSTEPGNGFLFTEQGATVSEPVKTQVVTVNPATTAVATGTTLTVGVNYQTELPEQAPASGMTLLLHFDSSKVSFDSVADLVPAGIRFPNTEAGIVVEDDPAANGGGDGDADTDKFIQVVWGTLDSSFPVGITTAPSVQLYQATFNVLQETGTADFNVSSTEPGNGFAFRGVNATVTVSDTPPNEDPVAEADEFTVRLGSNGVAGPALTGNVLNDNGNGADSDPDGDTLSVNILPTVAPTEGVLSLQPDGSFTYTPVAGTTAPGDSFTYQLLDGNNGVATAVVRIVFDTNTNPVAVDDTFSISVGNTLTNNVLTGSGVDTDAEGDTLTVETTAVTAPTQGTLSLNGDGSFTYTPFATATGTDSFEYQINDGFGGTDIATVTITINTDTFNFDLDGSGGSDPINPFQDGVILFAWMNNRNSPDPQTLLETVETFRDKVNGTLTASEIVANLDANAGLFDMDGNGFQNPFQDAVLVFALMTPGTEDSALTPFISPQTSSNPATRNAAEVRAYYDSLQGASNTAAIANGDEDAFFGFDQEGEDADLFGDEGSINLNPDAASGDESLAAVFAGDSGDGLWQDLLSL